MRWLIVYATSKACSTQSKIHSRIPTAYCLLWDCVDHRRRQYDCMIQSTFATCDHTVDTVSAHTQALARFAADSAILLQMSRIHTAHALAVCTGRKRCIDTSVWYTGRSSIASMSRRALCTWGTWWIEETQCRVDSIDCAHGILQTLDDFEWQQQRVEQDCTWKRPFCKTCNSPWFPCRVILNDSNDTRHRRRDQHCNETKRGLHFLRRK